MSDTEKMNEAMYERLGEIVFKAANTRTICNGASGADEKNLQLLAAFTDLRQMCEFYKPEEKVRVGSSSSRKDGSTPLSHSHSDLELPTDCPSLMPRQLPGGFDGVEPIREDSPNSPDSRSDAKKLEASVARQREVLTQIADLALAAEAKSGNEDVKLGSKFMDNSKAICAIRQLCGPDLVEKAQIESGSFYTPDWLCELAKKIEGKDKPLDPTAPEMKRGKGPLFKSKHISSCHGTYIYDRVCINGASLRATLHPDNGGLEQHATIWVDDSQRCFCYCTFNTTSSVKCDYVVRGMLAGLAKRLVYHHKNLIRRKAAAKAAAENGGQA